MSGKFELEKVQGGKSDYILFLLIAVLAGVGFSALFSSSYFYAGKYFNDSLLFIRKQLILGGAGVACGIIASRISTDFIRKYTPAFLLLTMLLILVTFIPGVGERILGARRWIFLFGFSFQPSELAKLAVILYLAHIFDKKQERMGDIANSIIPPFIIVGVTVGLVFLQNDFSTALFILVVSLLMFYLAGVPFLYFIFLLTAIVPLSIILLFTKPHRVERLIAFINPETDPVGSGYQIMAAQSALENGGFWGLGIGQGIKKMGGLPEVHSDFIFASLAEEAGFVGILCVLALFIGFAIRAYYRGVKSESRYEFLLVFGLTTCILYQAMFNIAVVAGLVPATGIPLPFFSSGGSSLFVTFIMCGLLMGITRRQNETEAGLL